MCWNWTVWQTEKQEGCHLNKTDFQKCIQKSLFQDERHSQLGPWILRQNRLKACFLSKTRKWKQCPVSVTMVYLTEHLGLAVVIWGKTAKFIRSVIRKECPCQCSVSPPPQPPNSGGWNPRVRMWEMVRTCSRFIHCWARFLTFNQKYLCCYCWNKWEFLHRHTNSILYDKFLKLQEMSL